MRIFESTHRFSRIAVVALALFCALGNLTCGSSETSDTQGDDVSEARTDNVRHDVSAEVCNEPITGSVAAGETVAGPTTVDAYEVSIDSDGLNVDLMAGETVEGRIETEFDLDVSNQGVLREWTVQTQLVQGEDTTASQTTRTRDIGEGRLWMEIVHRAGDTALFQWATVGDNFEPISIVLGVETDEAPDDAPLFISDGRFFETFVIIDEDTEASRADIDAWLADNGGEAFDGEAWTLLSAVDSDPMLWSGASAYVRRCQAAEIGPIEEELIVRSQSVCPLEAFDSFTARQGLCPDDDPLGRVLQVNDALGAFLNGATITGALVATGVVATGPAIGATLAVTVVASYVVEKKINETLQANSDHVFDGIFTAAGAATGDREGGQAAADFFKGSTLKGNSSGDPHLTTLDGLAYDLQAVGEFVLAETTGPDEVRVQVRQLPVDGALCPDVSYNIAVATEVGDTRITLDARRDHALWINGQPASFSGDYYALGDGSITRIDERHFLIEWDDETLLDVRITSRASSGDRLAIGVEFPESKAGKVRGLLGNFNGDVNDDFATRDGIVLTQPISFDDLYDVFAESWRIEQGESLLDYAGGEDTETFTDRSVPEAAMTVDMLDGNDRDDARQICEDAGITGEYLLNDCILDVACTDDSSYADEHARRDEADSQAVFEEVTSELVTEVLEPAPNRILWTFTDDTTNPDSHPAGVTVSAIENTQDIGRFEITSQYGYPNDPVLRIAPSQSAGGPQEAFDNDEYVEFQITPVSDPVTLSHFRVSMARGASIGDARGLQLRASHDNFQQILWFDEVLTERPDIERFSVPLPALTLDEATTFRLYMNTPGSIRTIEIGDIAVDLVP